MTRYIRAAQFAFALAALVMASAGMAQRAGLVAEATPHAVGWEAPADDRAVVALARVRGHEVPVYRIGELRAPDTPTGMDGFAVRVAYVLRGWTREHGVEAIGNLCRTPDGREWGTTLLTVGAHVASPVTNACPAGMLATGVDIHSHPQRQHYRANAVDELFVGRVPGGTVTTRPDTFGPDDYGHPGYMVGRIGLHYQHGLDRVRLVRDMRLPAPLDPAADMRRVASTHESGRWLAVLPRQRAGGVASP